MQAEGRTALRNSASHHRAIKALLSTAISVISLDAISKSIVIRELNTTPHQVIGTFLQLQRTSNSGAAFGVAQSATIFLSLLGFGAIVAIYLFSRSITSTRWGVALGFLLGGVCGNLLDRIFRAPYLLRGDVVDWIRLPHWPLFNVADTFIVISAVIITHLLLTNVKPRSFDEQ